MLKPSVLAACLAVAFVGPAFADPALTAPLKDAKGETLGTVTLTEAPNGVLLRIEAQNLAPGWHGLHFHEKGKCEAPKFESAGGHVHMGTGMPKHGLLNADATDAGDLPNLYVGADGKATAELFSDKVRLRQGAGSVPALLGHDGAAVIIHANPDDYVSQPIGGAGARIACASVS
ncbi:superoxide dismutase family protein [Lichenihabitans sp. Uapishka_5]|uniref:superoxide dismutase family protein n=1 Tax=Lichenihabitans sp. Uapishka_5 TaxID=3037302 RepID=UPI0029E7E297|nr:superoxide dismutase family protein [Lichenihabitans sp. Uapishka_5]MDX7953109.1 superoxide dismutase family protein [Lichenihabitans sp. Uapishka_5]